MKADNERYYKNKEDWTLLHSDLPEGMDELLKVRTFGCEKYDRMDWAKSKGQECHTEFYKSNLASMMSHLIALARGETHDKDSGCHHASHLALRSLFAIEYTDVNKAALFTSGKLTPYKEPILKKFRG